MYAQSCLTLCGTMGCNPQSSPIHGIFQARIWEWVAISFSRGLIFLILGSNPFFLCLLHWQMDALPLNHLRSPYKLFPLININMYYKYFSLLSSNLGFVAKFGSVAKSVTHLLIFFLAPGSHASTLTPSGNCLHWLRTLLKTLLYKLICCSVISVFITSLNLLLPRTLIATGTTASMKSSSLLSHMIPCLTHFVCSLLSDYLSVYSSLTQISFFSNFFIVDVPQSFAIGPHPYSFYIQYIL